ncbi:MAG: hypothetical protein C0436_03560 [Alphaproteobacteria bacterium]|nr:hypothetical protein [Alphaproteobacteria bacterium]
MHTTHDSASPAPLSPTYRALKFIAVAMGVLLILGFVSLLTFMGTQLGAGSGSTCEPTTIQVAGTDELMKIEEKDDTVTVWLKDASGAIVLRRHAMCSGDILRDVRVSGGRTVPAQGMPQGAPGQPPMPTR